MSWLFKNNNYKLCFCCCFCFLEEEFHQQTSEQDSTLNKGKADYRPRLPKNNLGIATEHE